MKVFPKIEYPAHIRLASARNEEPPLLALLIKRTYDIRPDGDCALADEQEPIYDDAVPYEELDPPKLSPPKWDNDLFAFKPNTDVVVQGTAHTYGRPVTNTTVELRFGKTSRAIKVYGDRICEWGPAGHPKFGPPEPFEDMPIRYDRAYGGQDVTALKRYGDPLEETYDFVRPEWKFSTTSPYHYPRNPTGRGYLIEADKESCAELMLPNLEWSSDPVTPERLAVGSVEGWMDGPLPAGFDWYEQSWFPRLAYLGVIPEHNVPAAGVPEVLLGIAAEDLMDPRSILDQQIHPWFVQGATPGLSSQNIRHDEAFVLRNLLPDQAEKAIRLPGEVPSAFVSLPMRKKKSLKPQMNSIVIRPDESKLIVLWSCRAVVQRPYGEPEFEHIPYGVKWKRR